MATNVPLQSIKLASTTTTVTFSNIDQSYNDLRFVVSGFTGGANVDVRGKINGDTGANYSRTTMEAVGIYLGGNYGQDQTWARFGWCPSGTTYQTQTLDFLNYNDTSNYKMVLQRATINSLSYMGAINWRGTAAITSIEFTPDSGGFNPGTTFDLYGIKSGAPKAFGGDMVATDGTYWYHAFKSTGALLTQVPIPSADIMVVAGGGGGFNGGGGAGGFRVLTSQTLGTATTYTVTVGAGGVGGGNPGTNSSIVGSGLTIISATGGGAGAYQSNGNSGGSGGGASATTNVAKTGGTGNAGSYSPVEGYAGGNSAAMTVYSGGGGGGAGGVGGNSTSSLPGAGGAGTSAYSSWGAATNTGDNVSGTYWYASGGSGSSQSNNSIVRTAGGGGQGDRNPSNGNENAYANTGGGGGGGYFSIYGNGGSGLVIVRYAV